MDYKIFNLWNLKVQYFNFYCQEITKYKNEIFDHKEKSKKIE